jgi:hypothetical protein
MEKESADALVRAKLPCLEKLSVADNMDLPKRHLQQKYDSNILILDDDEDEDEDDEEGDADKDMDDLIMGFKNTKLA